MAADENTGPVEQRKRLVMGMAMIGVGIALVAFLSWAPVNRWWGAGLFFPFWMGALGIFQALERT